MKSSPVYLYINKFDLDTPDVQIELAAHRAHRMYVSTDKNDKRNLQVTLKTIMPDGRTKCETKSGPDVTINIDPLTVPATYTFQAGVVYRTGYRFVIEVTGDKGERLRTDSICAVISNHPQNELFIRSNKTRFRYNTGYIENQGLWHPFSKGGRAMCPPVGIMLDPCVLSDPHEVIVHVIPRTDLALELAGTLARLTVHSTDQTTLYESSDLTICKQELHVRLHPHTWPADEVVIELIPHFDGTNPSAGPRLFYRKPHHDSSTVPVSPYAPYRFLKDPGRHTLTWEAEQTHTMTMPYGWKLKTQHGRTYLSNDPKEAIAPVPVTPQGKGLYALFVTAKSVVYLKTAQGNMRRIQAARSDEKGPVFGGLLDLPTEELFLCADDLENTGLYSLLLVPIDRTHAKRLMQTIENPPFELRGVNDWWCYEQHDEPSHNDRIGLMGDFVFEMILKGQRQLGLRAINWALGRSWVQYPSRLPQTDRFPCAPLTKEVIREKPIAAYWKRLVHDYDALQQPLFLRHGLDMKIYPWLCMNRHYGGTLGNIMTSKWVREQSFAYQRKRDGQIDPTRVELNFESSRKERLDIFHEVSGKDIDGLTVGFCRQPPMASYHPKLVADYMKITGIDAQKLRASDKKPFFDWIKWRADQTLNPLMQKLRRNTPDSIPIIARIPCEGLLLNMADGMDVTTWMENGWIQELQLNPLVGHHGTVGSQDVRPYVKKAAAHHVKVFGGINATTAVYGFSGKINPVVSLLRAIGLCEAGIAGVELYEAEILATYDQKRWLVPLYGDPNTARIFLAESNLEAVYPVDAQNAMLAHDNHWMPYLCLSDQSEEPRPPKRSV